jgi:TolB-like protein/Flp pilus assembly protein TadD
VAIELLIGELKRRRVFRVLIGYGIVAFAVLQIVEPVAHALHLPDEALTWVVVGFAFGFPVVVFFAWAFDIKAGRIERTPSSETLGRPLLAAVLVGIGLAAAAPGLIVYFFLPARGVAERTGAAAPPSIAVLPFVNMSSDKENEYFSDGMTEELINALANVEGLRVASRTSAFAFKGKNVNVHKIGEELNVTAVLEGSVRRNGNDLRVVVQLVDTAKGYHLWSNTYDRELKNVFQLEDELARSIAQALRPKLVTDGHKLARSPTENLAAHDLYLQGRYFWNKRSAAGLTKAAAFFQEAIDLDPRYALAYVRLADTTLVLSEYGWGAVRTVLPTSRAAAMKALELDPALAEAHASLCLNDQYAYEWALAEEHCRRAIALKPEYATAHHWRSQVLSTMGRMTEALAEARLAQQLDPVSAIISNVVTIRLIQSREYQAALEQARRTLELDPGLAIGHLNAALIHLSLNQASEAIAELEPFAGRAARYDEKLGYMYAVTGRRGDAERILAGLNERSHHEYVTAYSRAFIYLGLGDKEQALTWLEQAYEERDWGLRDIKVDPFLDPLRSEPRFKNLLRRLKLE